MKASFSRPLRALNVPLLVASLLPTASAQGRVLVVDLEDGPGTDFTSLYDAVNNAADGDTLLIREGVYNNFFLQLFDRSLSLVAEEGAHVGVPEIIVQGLGPDQTVVIRGLTSSESGPFLPALDIRDNQGTVWIENVDTTPGNGFGGGIEIRDSDNVVLVDVHSGWPTANPPSLDTLLIDNSVVSVFDSEIGGIPRSAGIEVNASRLYVQGSQITGGRCGGQPQGFPGILATDSEVFLMDTTVVGGSCNSGPDGMRIQSQGSTGGLLDGDATTLSFSGPETAGSTVEVAYEGRAGAVAFLLVSDESEPTPLLPFGTLLLSTPFDVLALGAVPASGRIETQFDLPAALPLGDYFGQVLGQGPTTATLSAPSSLTILP